MGRVKWRYGELAQILKQHGLTRGQYRGRIQSGMSHEEALNHKPTVVKGGGVAAECRAAGISRRDYYRMRERGISHLAALGYVSPDAPDPNGALANKFLGVRR